jgi:hypothetical protein
MGEQQKSDDVRYTYNACGDTTHSTQPFPIWVSRTHDCLLHGHGRFSFGLERKGLLIIQDFRFARSDWISLNPTTSPMPDLLKMFHGRISQFYQVLRR